jgi:CRISPR-associated protein Csm3
MSSIREAGRVRVQGRIVLLSGLHIGAGKDSVEIGGIDNPVIKHPHTGEPYIPGSSIKGKLRFLLEWAFGTVRDDGQAWGYNEKQLVNAADPVLRIFGNAIKEWDGGPTRLIMRDCPLHPEWRDRVLADGHPLFEEKTEVLIDRIKGKAHQVGPRQTERVPAGAPFDFAMVFRLYDTGDGAARDRACLNWTLQGLHLLEQDALGGSGSRGYGRIEFQDLRLFDAHGSEHALGTSYRRNRFDRENPPEIVPAEAWGVPA